MNAYTSVQQKKQWSLQHNYDTINYVTIHTYDPKGRNKKGTLSNDMVQNAPKLVMRFNEEVVAGT